MAYSVRSPLAKDHVDYISTLLVLTTVGEVLADQFGQMIEFWNSNSHSYCPRVVVDENDTVVATGTLLIEHKVIHECGKVGHIEDIAVAKSHQGRKLGDFLIKSLTLLAKEHNCYKVILDCAPGNVGFYEKCGYSVAGTEMEYRF